MSRQSVIKLHRMLACLSNVSIRESESIVATSVPDHWTRHRCAACVLTAEAAAEFNIVLQHFPLLSLT
jgi:hypothetical protein